MKHLLIDMSSVCWTALQAGKDEEFGVKLECEGKQVLVNSAGYGYENAMNHLISAMKKLNIAPVEMVFVVEGARSKSLRTAILPTYKGKRSARPPEAYVEFNKLKDMLAQTFMAAGATAVVQDGVEGDDVLAYLAGALVGEKYVQSADGDMAVLVGGATHLLRADELDVNPYGDFPHKYITLYKALVGDTSDSIPGAKGFGKQAWLDLCVIFGDDGLELLEGLVLRRELDALAEDVSSLKSLQKIIDGADMVYTSYAAAKLYPERVDMKSAPLRGIAADPSLAVTDSRLEQWGSVPRQVLAIPADPVHVPIGTKRPRHAIFDCEIMGTDKPVFLVCAKIVETGEVGSYWLHVEGDMQRLATELARTDTTWVSFNGIHFDTPLVCAAIDGAHPRTLKRMANMLIEDKIKHWECSKNFDFTWTNFDQIDLMEVSPGVRISLKTFAGRMAYPSMVDMPFHHDEEVTPEHLPIIESYCKNDLGVTEALFKVLGVEIDLRREMSDQHGIDLRSKSDAQVAEAVLKQVVGIKGNNGDRPRSVQYKAPSFIKTDSVVINSLIAKLECHHFEINQENGAVVAPDFLKEPIKLGWGHYQCGVGGIHSVMDKRLHLEAIESLMISDFDVVSYYPNIMMKAGLTPRLDGGKGSLFITEYKCMYDRRVEAKSAGNKKVSNTLKILLNGTFGKLGSPYSAFYSPDLMLAVTLTGQLNLMCLIYELEKIKGVEIQSANTDGIMVAYQESLREDVLAAIAANAAQTGFEYEETPYRVIAMKDVNNYIAITTDGVAKRKGLYTSNDPKKNPLYLMKNPTTSVCADMAVEYLKTGVHPRDSIKMFTNPADFMAVRNVKGGGIQFERVELVDDWVLVDDVGTKDNLWMRQKWLDAGRNIWDQGGGGAVRRKSHPHPVEVGVGGTPFGRVARWYMSTQSPGPLAYVGSGNKVPKTEGAMLCMNLPETLPEDLDFGWYITETISMLNDMGVIVDEGYHEVI